MQKYFFDPYDNREQQFAVPFLDNSFLQDLFPYCLYEPTYGLPHDVPRYHGVLEVQMLHIYPCDCSWQQRTYTFDPFSENLCLSDEVGEEGDGVRGEEWGWGEREVGEAEGVGVG